MDHYYWHMRQYRCQACNGYGICYGPGLTTCIKTLTSGYCKWEQCDNCHGIHTKFICCDSCDGTGIDPEYHNLFFDSFSYLNREEIIVRDIKNISRIKKQIIYGEEDDTKSGIAGIKAYNESIKETLKQINANVYTKIVAT